MMYDVVALHEAIEAVCPIVGISLADYADKLTWRIDFTSEATPAQQAAAWDVVDGWVLTEQKSWVDPVVAKLERKIDELTAKLEAMAARLA